VKAQGWQGLEKGKGNTVMHWISLVSEVWMCVTRTVALGRAGRGDSTLEAQGCQGAEKVQT